MKAAIVGETALEIRDVPAPKPKPNEVLVKIRAIGLNRAELPGAYGSGHNRVTGSIPGIECSGEVAEIGAEVQGVKVGDRVMCSTRGTYAEYTVADWGRVSVIPANNMSWEQAATYPSALGTMHDAIVTNGRTQPGDSVLIQGASSGVGIMGMQIAKLKGAKLVIGTSTNDARRAKLKDHGADLAIDTSKPNWSEDVLKATDGKGVNVIIDMVSASVMNENMKATAVLGRIINVGRLGGGRGEFDFQMHANKRISYIGVTHQTRSPDELRAEVRNMRADIWDAVTAGKLAIPIDRVFKLDDAEEAQARMRTNAHFGKIVMVV
ncbi:MAG TPA: zinc-binding dehydrogenase [Stellaceae bacterium]|jgi:NADPH2:quinone reductase|nr:zinc-binding dehydrogenase [Stellaceae bacterium]